MKIRRGSPKLSPSRMEQSVGSFLRTRLLSVARGTFQVVCFCV